MGKSGVMSGRQAEKLNSYPTLSGSHSHVLFGDGVFGTLHASVGAKTGEPTGNQAPGFGESFKVSQVTTNATGHVTALTTRTVTLPGVKNVVLQFDNGTSATLLAAL